MPSIPSLSIVLLIGLSYCNGQHKPVKESHPKIELIKHIPTAELGEGPHWDLETQSLYFVDIIEESIHRYVPATKRHTKVVIGGGAVTFIIPIRGQKNKFLVSIGRELAIVTWDGESSKLSNIEKILEVENTPDTLDNTFNDAKCDPSGLLWAGTMGGILPSGRLKPNKAALYTLKNRVITTQIKKVSVSNGLAWSKDTKKMFYADTYSGSVDQFDYDITTGTATNRRPLFTLTKHSITGEGPDGMTIDTDDNLWVAIFGGHRLLKISTKKPETLLESIYMPAKQVASVAFGGPNLEDLYITTGKLTIDGIILLPPYNGGIYRITGLNVRGRPGVSVVL